MLASRVARGSWAALRGSAAWAPGVRPSKGRARGALLPPAPCCLGCLAERWWLRPAALSLRLLGASPRNHCSGAGKAASGAAAGGGAAAEASSSRWGPAGAASLVRTPKAAGGRPWAGVAGPAGLGFGRSNALWSRLLQNFETSSPREIPGRSFCRATAGSTCVLGGHALSPHRLLERPLRW